MHPDGKIKRGNRKISDGSPIRPDPIGPDQVDFHGLPEPVSAHFPLMKNIF
jgi:hypothetical protein